MPKFYAVKNGRHIGIFNTWEECRREVTGFSGAEFKSFTSRTEAAKYIAGYPHTESVTAKKSESACAYVDGSYNIHTKEFSYGAVIFHNGDELTLSEKFSDPDMAQMRNVAGEIQGAMRAMRFCVENGVRVLDIYYDYEGIEKWCTGAWKANKAGTIAYKKYYDEIKQSLSVTFHKVKGHSGDKYNDMADRLAKDALGIK